MKPNDQHVEVGREQGEAGGRGAARTVRMKRGPDGRLYVERFTPVRRVEHLLVIATFVMLVLTGFPQKFFETSWAAWLMDLFGGLDTMRTIHHWAGIAFVVQAVAHLSAIVVGAVTGKLRLTLMPGPRDLRDAWQNLRYYLGYSQAPPRLPKFDYRQKFEYIGIVLGGLVMIVSGLVLLYPTVAADWMPGELIPAARVMHSNEALLALLVLVVWHVYGSHLSPEVFPMDKCIFTGYIEVEALHERHRLEFERIFPEPDEAEAQAEASVADADEVIANGDNGEAGPPEASVVPRTKDPSSHDGASKTNG